MDTCVKPIHRLTIPSGICPSSSQLLWRRSTLNEPCCSLTAVAFGGRDQLGLSNYNRSFDWLQSHEQLEDTSFHHKLGPRAFPVFPTCKGVGLLWSVGGGVTEICLHSCESRCPYCITVRYLGYGTVELVFRDVLHNGEKINLVSLTI